MIIAGVSAWSSRSRTYSLYMKDVTPSTTSAWTCRIRVGSRTMNKRCTLNARGLPVSERPKNATGLQCIGHGIGDSPAGEPSVLQTDAYASARYGVAG